MTKHRRPVNLRSFQVFEAVARHLSLTRAADELGITQSAVSHQLRALTANVGEPVIERHGRRIALTDTGARLARSLDSAFDIIEQQVTAIEGDRAMVRAGVYSSFAVGWLIPRLPAFMAAHPDIDLRLVMLYDPHEFSTRLADVFVTSEPVQLGFATQRLFVERLVPVIAPGGANDFSHPLPLISAEVEPGIDGRAWQAFVDINGLTLPAVRRGDWLCCSHYVLALEMVWMGLGAALLPDFMAARHVTAGTLVQLPGEPLPTGQVYELHVPVARRHETAIATFGAWLHRQLGGDAIMV